MQPISPCQNLKVTYRAGRRAPWLSCPATARIILSGIGPPSDSKQISSSSSTGPILPGSRGHYPTAQQLPRGRNCFHPPLSASRNPEERPWQSADSQVARISVNYMWPLAKARAQAPALKQQRCLSAKQGPQHGGHHGTPTAPTARSCPSTLCWEKNLCTLNVSCFKMILQACYKTETKLYLPNIIQL